MSEATRAEACEEAIDALRGTMSEGQLALEALVLYRASGLAPPQWALDEIGSCYSDFKHGAREEGWTQGTRRSEAPRTLAQSFGVDDKLLANAKLHARRQRAVLGPRVMGMFRKDGGLSRTEENYEIAAQELGISPAEVQGILRHFKE